jgi:hypothetical protein
VHEDGDEDDVDQSQDEDWTKSMRGTQALGNRPVRGPLGHTSNHGEGIEAIGLSGLGLKPKQDSGSR